jgi:hypothetical protein
VTNKPDISARKTVQKQPRNQNPKPLQTNEHGSKHWAGLRESVWDSQNSHTNYVINAEAAVNRENVRTAK